MDEEWLNESFSGCNVVFKNIKESYYPNETVPCYFLIKELPHLEEEKSEDCFIGLFSVGWDSLSSCKLKKRFLLAEKVSENNFIIEFDSVDTPESSLEDFYQFCFYNAKSEVVYGASCPFQICSLSDVEPFIEANDLKSKLSSSATASESSGNDFEETKSSEWWLKEEEFQESITDFSSDTVLVHNKTTLLEESLTAALTEKAFLHSRLIKLENDFESLENESNITKEANEKLNSELSSYKLKIIAHTEQENTLKELLLSAEDSNKHLKQQITTTKSNLMSEYEKKLSDMGKITEVSEKQERKLQKEIGSLKEEFSLLQVEYQKEVTRSKEKLGVLIAKNSKNEDLVDYHKIQYAKLEKDFNARTKHLNEKIYGLENALKGCKSANSKTLQNELNQENLKTANIELEKELQVIRHKFNIKNGENEVIISSLQQDNKKVKKENRALAELKKNLALKMEKLEAEIKQKKSELKSSEVELTTVTLHTQGLKDLTERLKHDLDSEQNKSLELTAKVKEITQITDANGAEHAWKVASVHLKKQVSQFKKEKDRYRKLYNDLLNSSENDKPSDEALIKENNELKTRLCLGKQSYDKVVMECQKLSKQLVNNPNVGSEALDTTPVLIDIKDLSSENADLVKAMVDLKERYQISEHDNGSLRESIAELDMRNKNLTQHYEEKLKDIAEEKKLVRNKETKPAFKNSPTGGENPIVFQQPSHTPSDVSPIIMNQPVQHEGIFIPPSCHIIDHGNMALEKNVLSEGINLQKYPPSSGAIPKSARQFAPSTQVIPNRSIVRNESVSDPVKKCPICQMDFPFDFTEELIQKHVVSHLDLN